ncbi:MAG: hypothetical protein K0R38_754 [Polyangiaceae bacterium]|nr:hypothetical protein [Polyangiaceae bacterium]
MRARIVSVLLVGAGLCGLVGCSDDSEAGNKDDFIAKLCAEYMGCCKAAGRPSDGAQCRAFYGAFAPAGGYDASAAQACLDEVRARQDQCDTSSASAPSCGRVFSSGGTKQPGETCDTNADCVAPDEGEVECVSEFLDGATVRQCQVQLPGKLGSSPCLGTRDGNFTSYAGVDGLPPSGYICDKADGLSCNGQTGACESLAAVGASCAGSAQCLASAYCDFSAQQCKARLAVGAACTAQEQCAESTYCDADTDTCTAHLAPGAACTTDAQCAADDCTNGECGAGNDLGVTLLCGS